jgi:hypothetical protein
MSEKKICFVIGPIGDPGTPVRSHADWLFDAIIKPVFAEHFRDEFEVPVRADKIVAPGSINSQIITRLLEVPLVIADLSLHNANAFYELAIRHMVRKPTIHIHHKDWKPPFDVAGFRAIPFSRDEWLDVEKARGDLKSTVEEVIKPGFEVENPITHSRGVIKVSEHASPEQRVLLDRLDALERQIQELARSVVHLPFGYSGTSGPSGVRLYASEGGIPISVTGIPEAGTAPVAQQYPSTTLPSEAKPGRPK